MASGELRRLWPPKELLDRVFPLLPSSSPALLVLVSSHGQDTLVWVCLRVEARRLRMVEIRLDRVIYR